ncbi:MAG: iron-containing redox enzyme family protein [Kofleriaceae bacterium]
MDTQFHEGLMELNRSRLAPSFAPPSTHELEQQFAVHEQELRWIESERALVSRRAALVPVEPEPFVRWFEGLKLDGPGQGDPLFPWLAATAKFDQIRWFLHQEVAGEAGFEDLVALTQLRMPERVKLELARNYWDEMGRGHESGMHGPMLARMAVDLDLATVSAPIVPESTALGNLLAGLASNRGYAYQSVGALGVVELTAPGRAALVNAGLKRLGIAPRVRQYYALHATLDIKHSEAWNAEVLGPLVACQPRVAPLIAEGALMRLEAGARCFVRYRSELSV